MALDTSKLDTALSDFSKTLTSQQLAPQQDMVLPELPSATATDELGGVVEQTDPLVAETATQAKTAEKGTQDALGSLLESMAGRTGFEGLSLQAEKEAGVQPAQMELLDIQDRRRREELARRRAVEGFQTKGGGLKSGAQAEINTINRQSYSKQADLAIVELAAQGRYDSAKEIADRQAKALFEQEENEIETRKFFYQENKDLFDKADQRLFEMRLADRERKLENERADFETLQSVKLQALQMAQTNDAPPDVLSAIQSAQSPEEVMQVGGQWGSVDMLERSLMVEQLNKLREKPETLAPTSVIDQGGRKLLINTQTGEVIKDFGIIDVGADELSDAITVTSIMETDALKSHPGMHKAVGPSIPFFPDVSRFTPFSADVTTGQVSDFTASVEFLTSGLTLDELAKAKERGTTFGALSKDEWVILAATATKIGTWKRERDDGSIYYDTSEEAFNKEIDRISNFKKLDAYLKGAEPSSIGVVVTNDGVFAQNADGSVTKLR